MGNITKILTYMFLKCFLYFLVLFTSCYQAFFLLFQNVFILCVITVFLCGIHMYTYTNNFHLKYMTANCTQCRSQTSWNPKWVTKVTGEQCKKRLYAGVYSCVWIWPLMTEWKRVCVCVCVHVHMYHLYICVFKCRIVHACIWMMNIAWIFLWYGQAKVVTLNIKTWYSYLPSKLYSLLKAIISDNSK